MRAETETPIETLLVDDVERFRRLVARSLSSTGTFKVVGEAGNGEDAIDQAVELEPDLVLLDLSMPRMDGLEALTEIRRRVPGVHVVVLSGFSAHRLEGVVEDQGALAYIEKGIEPNDLIHKLHGLLLNGQPPDVRTDPRSDEEGRTRLHLVSLDDPTGDRVASLAQATPPRWTFTRSSDPAGGWSMPEDVDVIAVAVNDCEGECASTVHSLSTRHPAVALVVAVPNPSDACLKAAAEAGATSIVDLRRVDGESFTSQLRWAMLAEERDRSRTRRLEMLAGTMAHDLRHPLRVLDRYAGWVTKGLEEGDDERVAMATEGIERGVKRARRLIDSQLEYAQVQTKPSPAQQVDPREALDEVLESLSERIERCQANLEIQGLPDVVVPREQLVVLFRNLLSNAIKYREPGTAPTVEVWGETVRGDAYLRVRDDGIGIPPDHHESIFDPFSRLHAEQDYPGTGLGLAICRQIVDQWGGTIEVESTPGQGTTMTVLIPSPGTIA